MRLLSTVGCVLALMLAGCAGLKAKYAPLLQPDAEPLVLFCASDTGPAPPLTDARAACFAATLASQLHAHESAALNGHDTGAALQVLLAAAAAGANFAAPGSVQAAQAAFALASGSAIVPEMEGVLGLAERADIYANGLMRLQDGEAAFFACVVRTTAGVVATDHLTLCGAALYGATIGTAELTERRRAGMSVNEDALQRASPTTVVVVPAALPAATPVPTP